MEYASPPRDFSEHEKARMRKPQEPELELGIGAASYLKFLEINVARAQKRLDESHAALDQCLLNQRDKPDELDGEDYEVSTARARAECKDAQESMLRLGKQLLEFDKSVDTNRRDVS